MKKRQMEMIDFKKYMIRYLIVFGILMLVYCSVNRPIPMGEYDDYSLPIASILNDRNFGISNEDVNCYKRLYPDWSKRINSFKLSGYTTRDGREQLTWYFPTYGVACIPLTLLCKWLMIPTIYSFPFTNLAALMIALFAVVRYLKCDDKRKLLLIVLLSLNPVVFYISWPSAEVFIYSILTIGIMFWYNREYKKAAFFVSLAGTLNPTILSIGIVMILEYLINVNTYRKSVNRGIDIFFDKNVVQYFCCYIIAVIPMFYFLYHTGHINLTASYSGFVHGQETVFQRFGAYLLDLNFGILPYYVVLFSIAFVFLLNAIIKKKFRYIEWIVAFIFNVALFSIMVHINCGMVGIARYNVWGSVILIFSVVLVGLDNIEGNRIKSFIRGMLYFGVFLTTIIIYIYNPYLAINVSYVSFSPIAKWVLNNAPELYNPLFSTFNSRISHIDGGYNYKSNLPLIYVDDDGYVRKVLASSLEKNMLLIGCKSERDDDNIWFKNKVNGLGADLAYISIPKNIKIVRTEIYIFSKSMVFKTKDYNAKKFILKGISHPEKWGSWTDGKEAKLAFCTNSNADELVVTIRCRGRVFNKKQYVSILVNGCEVYQDADYDGKDNICFSFKNPGVGKRVEFIIKLPKAMSPKSLKISNDPRNLALGIEEIKISEKK